MYFATLPIRARHDNGDTLETDQTKRPRKRRDPNAPKRKPGRPKTPPEMSPNYERQSVSLPGQAFRNLEALARFGNVLARSGPNYGQPSWRSWLYHFAMEDIPIILALLESHPEELHLTLDKKRSYVNSKKENIQ